MPAPVKQPARPRPGPSVAAHDPGAGPRSQLTIRVQVPDPGTTIRHARHARCRRFGLTCPRWELGRHDAQEPCPGSGDHRTVAPLSVDRRTRISPAGWELAAGWMSLAQFPPQWNLAKRRQDTALEPRAVETQSHRAARPRRSSRRSHRQSQRRARLRVHEAIDRHPGHGRRADAGDLDCRVREDGHPGTAPHHAR